MLSQSDQQNRRRNARQEAFRHHHELLILQGIGTSGCVGYACELEGFLAVWSQQGYSRKVQDVCRLWIHAQPDSMCAAYLLERIQERLRDDTLAVIPDDHGISRVDAPLQQSEQVGSRFLSNIPHGVSIQPHDLLLVGDDARLHRSAPGIRADAAL